jgi:hypothetical protein
MGTLLEQLKKSDLEELSIGLDFPAKQLDGA